MSYSVANIKYAEQELLRRKMAAEETNAARRREIIKRFPEIGEYIKQIADIDLKILDAIGDKENFDRRICEITEANERVQKIIEEKLVENGYPANYLEIPYTCKKCADTGYIDGITCECRRDLLNQLNVRDLESVSPAKECTFDTFSLDYYSDKVSGGYSISPKEQMQMIYNYCKDYAEDFDSESGSLYMYGETGLGKTHLSLAIANVAARKGYSVFYSSAQTLLADAEREKFGGSDNSNTEKRAIGCDLLIIDDLGCEFLTQYTAAEIYTILNERINRSKPFIISTNLKWEELEKRYTGRLTSRIIGNCTRLLFLGNDIRQIKSEN